MDKGGLLMDTNAELARCCFDDNAVADHQDEDDFRSGVIDDVLQALNFKDKKIAELEAALEDMTENANIESRLCDEQNTKRKDLTRKIAELKAINKELRISNEGLIAQNTNLMQTSKWHTHGKATLLQLNTEQAAEIGRLQQATTTTEYEQAAEIERLTRITDEPNKG